MELGEKHFPRHKTVETLRSVLAGEKTTVSHLNGGKNNGNSLGGSCVASVETSPEQYESAAANISVSRNHEDSLLWSAGGSVLNGSRREVLSTPRGSSSILGEK